MRCSSNRGVQMVGGDGIHGLFSHPYLVLISVEGNKGGHRPCDSGVLSDAVGEAGRGKVPR